MWDASPLVDAGTDQLIYPGENGILYIIHLNTLYDEAAGSLTVNPDNIVKWRYDSLRTTTYTYWSGFEASPVCWQGHIIMADNGGNLMCLDLNTLKLDWVSDVLDDTSCSPVLSVEEDGVYVYIGAAFHPGWRSDSSAVVPIWKINAVTGETIWKAEYTCTGDGGMSGGVQGTIAVGSKKLAGMIFVPIASTPDAKSGTLAALDTKTGKQLWKFDTNSYSWSSPADVYDEKGNGYLVYCTADGSMYLLDGLTGNKLDVFDLGGAVEASPAVYDDWAVIGTRGCKIWGVKLG
jgi:outer membrane protein assembly factor BamB